VGRGPFRHAGSKKNAAEGLRGGKTKRLRGAARGKGEGVVAGREKRGQGGGGKKTASFLRELDDGKKRCFGKRHENAEEKKSRMRELLKGGRRG